jgi:hypothetical protein
MLLRVAEQIERVLYEESVRTIDGQRELLEGVRTRAGTLLATAFVATALFGAQALDRRPLGALEWSGIGLFLIVVVSALIVLTPWRLQLTHHPHTLIAYHLETAPVSLLAEVYRDLVYWNGVNYDDNGRKLETLLIVFGIACASLVAEVVVWLVVLGGA